MGKKVKTGRTQPAKQKGTVKHSQCAVPPWNNRLHFMPTPSSIGSVVWSTLLRRPCCAVLCCARFRLRYRNMLFEKVVGGETPRINHPCITTTVDSIPLSEMCRFIRHCLLYMNKRGDGSGLSCFEKNKDRVQSKPS